MARMSVVLPAPLGPSRPVTPGPNEQDSSDRATLGPNHTDTSVTSTVGSATKAGSSEAREDQSRSRVGLPVAQEEEAQRRQHDDEVVDHGQQAASLDAAELGVSVDVAEEHEVAEVAGGGPGG